MKIEEYVLWIHCIVHSRFGDPLLLGSGVTTYHSKIESYGILKSHTCGYICLQII